MGAGHQAELGSEDESGELATVGDGHQAVAPAVTVAKPRRRSEREQDGFNPLGRSLASLGASSCNVEVTTGPGIGDVK